MPTSYDLFLPTTGRGAMISMPRGLRAVQSLTPSIRKWRLCYVHQKIKTYPTRTLIERTAASGCSVNSITHSKYTCFYTFTTHPHSDVRGGSVVLFGEIELVEIGHGCKNCTSMIWQPSLKLIYFPQTDPLVILC